MSLWELRVIEDDFTEPRNGFMLGRYLNEAEASAAFWWSSVREFGLVVLDPAGNVRLADDHARQMLRLTPTLVQLRVV